NVDVRREIQQIGAWRLGPDAKKLREVGLKDRDQRVRLQTLYSLQKESGDHSALLTPLIKDKSPTIRAEIIPIFQKAGEDGVPPLVAMLKDADPEIRFMAITGLAGMKEKAGKALPAVRLAVKDADGKVRVTALGMLVNTGKEKPADLV